MLYRKIFAKHYPGEQVVKCIPDGPSIACSTPTAIAWDASFKNAADPSGRSIKSIHGIK